MKKILLIILLTVSTNIFSNNTYLDGNAYLDGNTLINLIRSNLIYENQLATQYILGVVDTNDGECNWKLTGVSGGQLNQITKNFLEKHPEYWNYNASMLVNFAIVRVYGCKK